MPRRGGGGSRPRSRLLNWWIPTLKVSEGNRPLDSGGDFVNIVAGTAMQHIVQPPGHANDFPFGLPAAFGGPGQSGGPAMNASGATGGSLYGHRWRFGSMPGANESHGTRGRTAEDREAGYEAAEKGININRASPRGAAS